jgi:hypothetical protein
MPTSALPCYGVKPMTQCLEFSYSIAHLDRLLLYHRALPQRSINENSKKKKKYATTKPGRNVVGVILEAKLEAYYYDIG